MGQACPGEVVTYTCTVDQAATVGWTAAPVLTDPTAVQFLTTQIIDQRMRDCSSVHSVRCTDLDFFASLTSVGIVQNGLADLISTFTFTAKAALSGMVVLCSATTENSTPTMNQSLIIAGKWISPIFMHANYDMIVGNEAN